MLEKLVNEFILDGKKKGTGRSFQNPMEGDASEPLTCLWAAHAVRVHSALQA